MTIYVNGVEDYETLYHVRVAPSRAGGYTGYIVHKGDYWFSLSNAENPKILYDEAERIIEEQCGSDDYLRRELDVPIG